jgi:hypothetical protein
VRIVVVGVLAMGAPAAVAQEGTPSPQELWDAYPLDPETSQSQAGASNGAPPPTGTAAGAGVQNAAGAAAGTTDGSTATGEPAAESGDSSLTVPALVGAALLAFAVGLAAGQASRRRTAGDHEAAATADGERTAAAANGERPAATAGNRRAPRPKLRTAPRVPAPRAAPPAPAPERPPPAFDWVEPAPPPPAQPPPAFDWVERAPQPPEQPPPEFEWVEPASRAPEPAAPPPAESPPPPPPEAEPVADDYAAEREPFELPWRRFARDTPWPEAAELWTCEIGWKPGYLKSTFRALVAAPGEHKRKAVADSPPLRWTLMMDPDPDLPEVAEAVRVLAATIERAGWEQTDPGEPWFAKRFVWRGEGRPPRIQSFSGGVNA